MATWKQVVLLIAALLLVVLLLLGWLTEWGFLAVGALLLGAFALLSAETTEISLAKILEIKRDARAVRESRKQVEQQAEEIRAIRDQIKAMEEKVAEQARSIEETAGRVAQSESEVAQAKLVLQILALKLHETQIMTFAASYSLSYLTLAEPSGPEDTQEARLEKVHEVLDLVLPRLREMTKLVVSPEEITPDSIEFEPVDFDALFRKAGLLR